MEIICLILRDSGCHDETEIIFSQEKALQKLEIRYNEFTVSVNSSGTWTEEHGHRNSDCDEWE